MLDERSFEAYRMRALHQVDDALKEAAAAHHEAFLLVYYPTDDDSSWVDIEADISWAAHHLARALRMLGSASIEQP